MSMPLPLLLRLYRNAEPLAGAGHALLCRGNGTDDGGLYCKGGGGHGAAKRPENPLNSRFDRRKLSLVQKSASWYNSRKAAKNALRGGVKTDRFSSAL